MAYENRGKGPKKDGGKGPGKQDFGRGGKPAGGKYAKGNTGKGGPAKGNTAKGNTAYEWGKGKDSDKDRYSRGTSSKGAAGKGQVYDKQTGRSFEKTGGRSSDRALKSNERQYERRSASFADDFEDEEDNINLIEGRNPVLEALKSGREMDKIFVQKGASEGSIRQIIAIAREKNIVIKEVDKAKLDGLSKTKAHQGVIASAALYKYYDVDEILQIAEEKGEEPFLILLDEITDNNNLGSILRTAEAAGVHGIVIPKRRSVGLTPVVAKTSAGAVEYVPVAKVTNISQTIDYLKKRGLWVVGADMSGETYHQKDLTGPMALVIGSEGEGMGRLVKEHCDFLVKIPMRGKISSLNAAVSTAIIVYEIEKQRSTKQIKGSTH